MGFFSDHKGLQGLLLPIILWGCFGGICFAAACFYALQLEDIVYLSCYSGIVSPVYPFWKFGTLIILSFTLGLGATNLFCTCREPGLSPVRIGLISGVSSTLVAILLVEIFPLGLNWIHYPFYMAGTFIISLIIYILIFTTPQVLGAWYQGSRQRFGQKPADPSPSAITCKRYPHEFFFVALLIILLVLPLGLIVLPIDDKDYSACPAIQTLDSGNQCGYGRPPDNVTVTRAGPDSIYLSLKASSLKCGSQNSFTILLNGNDVSNQAMIAKSRLNVTITPSDGLGRQDGAYVILQGRDLIMNETTPPHIQIKITDRTSTWIHRDLYL
jgi:hypothetical protein